MCELASAAAAHRWPRLELRVKAGAEHGHRSPIAVVAGMENELIVWAHPPAGTKRQAVIGFENLLWAWMRQSSVPDENAEATVIEKGRMHIRDAVDDAPSQFAYLGFAAGAGGAHNLQEVHLDFLTAWFEGQSHSQTQTYLLT